MLFKPVLFSILPYKTSKVLKKDYKLGKIKRNFVRLMKKVVVIYK